MNLSSLSPVVRILAVSVLLTFQPCLAADESKPIVDVRFDAAYRQIESSDRDEWAPTWGRDDVLYTGNDDGTNFGGIPTNVIAFGELIGNDPYNKLNYIPITLSTRPLDHRTLISSGGR